MNNYIINNYEVTKLVLTEKSLSKLKALRPTGCPYANYSLFDLLQDFMAEYCWKVLGKNSIKEFIEKLQWEGYTKAVVYGSAIIEAIVE